MGEGQEPDIEQDCEVCDEPLAEEDTVYAGHVMRVHLECHPQQNLERVPSHFGEELPSEEVL